MEAKQTVDYHKKIDLRCPQLDKVDFRGHTTPQFDFQVSAENKEQAPIREQTYPPEYYLALKKYQYIEYYHNLFGYEMWEFWFL